MLETKRLKLKVRFSLALGPNVSFGHSHSLHFVLHHEVEAEQKEREAKAKGEDNYKGDSKFATHLKSSSGVSSFAKTRTLKEQREYLPAFACREELMKVLRENQGLSYLLLFNRILNPSQLSLSSEKQVQGRQHNSPNSCMRMVTANLDSLDALNLDV